MSGNKHNDDAIERLFREKAGEYDIPYREEDWLKLEKKLDVQDTQIMYRRRVRWIAAASLLLISLMGYFTYENHIRINELRQQLDGEAIVETGEERMMDDFLPERIQTPAIDDELAEITRDQSASDELTSVEPPAGIMEKLPYEQVSSAERDGIVPAIEQSGRARERVDETIAMVQPEYELPIDGDEGLRPVRGGEGLTGGTPSAALLTKVAQDGSNSPSTAPRHDQTIDRTPSSRLTLGMVMSPDLTTVGAITDFFDPGYKLGLSVEYKLTSRMAISTGLVSSLVRYKAGGQYYDSPDFYNQSGAAGGTPDELTGECLLIDIPVTLSYQFLKFDRSRLFATAGVSSYIMLNEKYEFKYYNGYGNSGTEQYWSDRTGTRHWLSNAGISIGYERDIHPDWSVRVEPFVRVPIREVGWANVRLYSMGSFFSINYRL